ncbi:TPA: ribonuclease J [Candidatus Nomurabacteria bacterium]|nr:ribonuclease J [Candidatus Nomurabacteria bacterium]
MTTNNIEGEVEMEATEVPGITTPPPTQTRRPFDRNGGQRRTGGNSRGRPVAGPKFDTTISTKRETDHIPPLKDGDIRVIHFGGVEEIGRNMSMIEYKDSIVVVDCGVQFTETHTPGIDFILPNAKYLEENRHKIKGVMITHGHLDHIGAIPYIMPRIGNPQIYARLFTSLMIKKRQEEFPHLAPLTINVIEKEDMLTFGELKVRFFGVSHAIPDAMGIIVETPLGDIVHTGDLRLDHDNDIPTDTEVERYKIFENKNVLLLMADSTNCENPGFSISDRVVFKNIENVIKDTPGRLIVSTFASQVERMIYMLKTAEDYGKKVVIEGRSMKTNVEVARLADMLHIRPETLIPIEDLQRYPDNKVVIMATGAQGEEFAALGRIANKTHKYVRLTPRDTILMSSSIVPGNERAVQNLKDKLSRQGAHLIHYKTSDIHSSGHANSEELVWIHRKIHPKFFIPVHGYHYMLRMHADIEKRLGMMEENILVPDNGMIIEIQNEGNKIVALKEKAPCELIVVDGTSVGKIQDVVMRDRQTLAEDGMFVVIGVIDSHTHTLKKSPDLISRGFVYLKESQELLYQTRLLTKKVIEDSLAKGGFVNLDQMKQDISEATTKFLLQKTAKRPVIIPVIISI